MSLAVLAQNLASKGRNGDTMLVHMAPSEIAGLQALGLKHGVSMTVNPETGLLEAFSFRDLFKAALPVLAGFALGPAGFGVMSSLQAGLTVGAVTGLATGSLQKGIVAGLGAYGGSTLGEGFIGAGEGAVGAGALASEAGQEAIRSKIAAGLSEEAARAAVAKEAVAGAGFFDKLVAGGKEVFAPGGIKALQAGMPAGSFSPTTLAAMAAAPIIADQMVPTKTSMPTAQPGDTGYVRSFQFNPNTQGLQYLGAVPANQIRPAPVNRAPAPAPAPAPYPYEQPPSGYNSGGIVALASGGALTPEIARSLMQRSMTTGVPTSEFDKYGGYDKVFDLYRQQGGTMSISDIPKADLQKYADQVADTGVGNLLALKETGTPLGLEGLIGMSRNEIDLPYIQNAINQVGLEGFTPTGDYTGLQGRYTTLQQQNAALQQQIADLQGRLKPATTTPGGVPPSFTAPTTTVPGTTGTSATYGGGTLNQQQNAGLGNVGGGYRGSETMAQLRDEYTRGGGRLGVSGYATPEPVLTGGSKQAYDYLMGRGAYPVAPFTPPGTPIMRPYTDIIEGATRPSAPTITLPKKPDRATAQGVGSAGVNTGVTTGGSKLPDFGFTPPAKDDIVTQAVQRWRNRETGEVFLAPTGGYKPPGPNWELDRSGFAKGGLSAVAASGAAGGGQFNLGGYSDGGRLLRGPGDGVSDSIPATIGNRQPARLADGEFVIPARIVSEIGNGSTEAGARKLYAMMDRVQRARAKTTGKGKVAKNTRADKYLPA